MLFEYAVVKKEKRDRNTGDIIEEEAVLIDPAYMLAKDDGQARLKIARMIPEDQIEDSDRIAILVRPF